jgi:hypothetical protein
MAEDYTHGTKLYESVNTGAAQGGNGLVGICTGLTVQWILGNIQNPGKVRELKPSVDDAMKAQSTFFAKMSGGQASNQSQVNDLFYAEYGMFREAAKQGDTVVLQGVPIPRSVSGGLSELFKQVYEVVDQSRYVPSCYHLTLASPPGATPSGGRVGHAIGLLKDSTNGLYLFDPNFGCYQYTDDANSKIPGKSRFKFDMTKLFWTPGYVYHELCGGKLWLQRAFLFGGL